MVTSVTKSSVLMNGILSEPFSSYVGVLLGKVPSATLFSLYVNDCLNYILRSDANQDKSMNMLMCAHDMALICDNPIQLQSMLDDLNIYGNKRSLTVNDPKTKIVVFRNSIRLTRHPPWKFNGENH